MKAKEINEGLFGNLSRTAKSTLKSLNEPKKPSLFKTIKSNISSKFSGADPKDKMAFDKFKNNFISRGMQAIDNAIKTGLADPNTNVISKVAAGKGKQSAQKIPQLHKDVEIVNLDPIIMRWDKNTYVLNDRGEWVDKKKGKPVQQGVSAFLTQQQNIAIDLANLQTKKTRKPKAKASATTGTTNPAAPPAAPAAPAAPGTPVPESHYGKLNSIFESYMMLSEQKVPSISEWFKVRFLDPYLQGIDLSSAKPQIDQFLANLPTAIQKGTLKKELENIATIAWTLSSGSR